jgi:hypothetical protein
MKIAGAGAGRGAGGSAPYFLKHQSQYSCWPSPRW